MAKDGTARGGSRVGSGRKPKALVDKIADGRLDGAMVLPTPTEIEGVEVPPIKEYLKAKQKSGKDLCAEEVYRDTYAWLKARGCERLVNNQLIEQYAMSVSRWIQCEECISEYGFLAKLLRCRYSFRWKNVYGSVSEVGLLFQLDNLAR